MQSFSFPTFLRIFGLVLSAAGLIISMKGLFLPWFSDYNRVVNSVITGLDLWVHGDWLTILSYSLAWIVFLTYCFKPNYVGLCTTFFSHVLPIFYIRLQFLVVFGHRGTPDNIFESGGGGVDFPLTPEPGLSSTFVGMGLILIGVFIGMNNQNKKFYLTTMIPMDFIYLLNLLN
ncbi:MAG: hypothetical protein RIG27_29510 [Coleofasciculus sp. F4-SAH-05]